MIKKIVAMKKALCYTKACELIYNLPFYLFSISYDTSGVGRWKKEMGQDQNMGRKG